MKFFIDTADLNEIAEAKRWGCLSGVTTNPSLYAKTGGSLAHFEDHMLKIAELCEGLPVSAESTAPDADGMIAEGLRLSALASNIVVKLPVCEAGLQACRTLADKGVRVNMTLVFSVPQALLAARAGARYVSPFVGRLDDVAQDGSSALAEVVSCLHSYDWTGVNPDGQVEIIAASVRGPLHVTRAAQAGTDIATVPLAALKACLGHPLTDRGLAAFEADWKKVEQSE